MQRSLSRHSRALEAGFAATLLSVALLALPLFAEEAVQQPSQDNSFYAQHIVRLFQKVGAESIGAFDNTRFDTSAFDFAKYESHTCFRPTEFDMAKCKDEFGPYFDLKATKENGQLAAILANVSYMKGASALVAVAAAVEESAAQKSNEEEVSQIASSSSSSSSSLASVFASEADERSDIDQRSAVLWNICQKKFVSRADAARCYQRNIRRTMFENNLPTDENVF